jgi:probable F420-dependent oxidoreductase
MILAHTAWDLQKVSGGRFVLGLGTQVKAHNERRFSLKWEPPGPRLREVVLALRAIWECWQTGAPLNFRGRSYRFDLMTPFFNPGPIEHPRIPIYIAAVNPYMAQMAGEICDGLHVHSFHSPKYLREVIRPAVEAGLAKSGRRIKDFTFRASTMVVVGDDPEELERNKRAVKQQIAFYASTRTYQAVLAVHGLDHLVPQLHAKSLAGDWEGMAELISDETLDHFAVTATWDALGGMLRQRYEGICDRTQLYPAFQPSLDDPRLQALIKEMNQAAG